MKRFLGLTALILALVAPQLAAAQALQLASFQFTHFGPLASTVTLVTGVADQRIELFRLYVETSLGSLGSFRVNDSNTNVTTPFFELASIGADRRFMINANIDRVQQSFWFRTDTGDSLLMSVNSGGNVGGTIFRGWINYITR